MLLFKSRYSLLMLCFELGDLLRVVGFRLLSSSQLSGKALQGLGVGRRLLARSRSDEDCLISACIIMRDIHTRSLNALVQLDTRYVHSSNDALEIGLKTVNRVRIDFFDSGKHFRILLERFHPFQQSCAKESI